MAFVVDASIAGSWFLPDEATAVLSGLAFRMVDEGAAAPNLLWHEVRNLLIVALRRGRLLQADLETHLASLEALPVRDVGRGDARLVARLAQKHGLTAYDAAYLTAAIMNELPLASLDKGLRAAAKAEGISLLPKTP
jgi:predicted nucleic acid-binding protein